MPDDVLTLTDASAVLTTSERALADLERELAAARSTYAHRVSVAGSDSPRVRDEYAPALADAERGVARRADAVEREVRRVVALTGAVPRPVLTAPADEERAARLWPLVAAEVERDPLPALVAAVRHAIVTEDLARQFLYFQALGRRLDQPPPADGRPPDAAEAVDELRRLRSAIADRLADRRLEPLKPRASALLERAQRLKHGALAEQRRAELEQRYAAAGMVPWPDRP